MTQELKSCPFCGSKAALEFHTRKIVLSHDDERTSTALRIRCLQCGVSSIEFTSESTAAMWWNRRT